jgi:NADH:ubiquinone oxidoreductase subunit K
MLQHLESRNLVPYLFLFLAVILTVLGIGSLLLKKGSTLHLFYSLFMFADAAAMVFCYFQLTHRSRLGYWLVFFHLASEYHIHDLRSSRLD